MRIDPFDPRNASDRQYAAATEFSNRIRAEILPDDPPVPVEERIQGWRNIPAFVETSAWHVWREDGSEIIGSGNVNFLRKEENRHVVDFGIWVLPEFRRQHIARRLLALIVEVPKREDRRLMITSTNGAMPAGEAFMKQLGAQMARANHINQLDLQDLNRDHVREKGSRRIAGFTGVGWQPNRPQILYQYGTAVFPEYQNRGLGRWLKAAMLEKVLRDLPQVRYVRTGNADMNAPMLKINQELGFKPYRSNYDWQVETEKVLEYLRTRGF